MATTLEYDLKVDSTGVESGAAAVDNLGSKLTDTKTASEGLAKSLEKQEARIKIIDGAINLLGGSVELAAGAFVGLGLASEEQAEQFQTAALGAIAFADGAKRSFDGVKSLTEGLKSYGGIAGAARKVQLALNAAVLANPYIAAGVALAALTAAFVVYYNSQVDSEEASKSGAAAIEAEIKAKEQLKQETDRLREALDAYIATQGKAAKAADREVALAQAQGKSETELLALRKKAIQERLNDLNRQLGGYGDNAELENEIREKIKDEENNLLIAQAEFNTRRKADRDKNAADSKANSDRIAADSKAASEKAAEDQKQADDDKIKATQDTEDAINVLLQSEAEKQILSAAKTYDDLIEQARTFGLDTTALEEARGVAIQEVIDTQAAERTTKQDEANAKEVADAKTKEDALQAVRDLNLANASQAIAALGSLFEEGTAASKAAAIAEIAIRTGEGFVNGLGIAQKTALAAPAGTGAFIFPLFYAAQIASVLAAANQARKILGTGPSVQKPNVPAPPSFSGGGAFTGNLPGTGPTPTTPVTQEPIRAYVVARDVSTGQEANAAIRRRRRLGGG